MGALTTKERIAARRAGIAANRSKGLRPYKFKSGKTTFRILPAAVDGGEWDRRFGIHYLKSFDKQQFFAIGDKDITYGQTDPIRELLFDAMRQSPDEDIKKHYQDMIASPRIIFNALILDDKDQSPVDPVLIETSETAFDGILAQFDAWTEEDPNYDLAGLSTGHKFTCEKSGTGLDTRYVFLATPAKLPLKPIILEKLIDMDAWISSQFESKEQKALEFLGKLNGAIGISTVVPGGTLGAPAATAALKSNVSTAAVTSMLEDDDVAADVAAAEAAIAAPTAPAIEDAVFEEVEKAVAEESPFADDTADAAQAAADVAAAEAAAAAATAAAVAAQAAATAAAAKAAKPAAATAAAAAAPVAQAQSDEIDSILADL